MGELTLLDGATEVESCPTGHDLPHPELENRP